MRVLCPAKINLFLSVGPPDRTGYHPIRTLFQAVGLFDEIIVEPAARFEVTSDWTDLPEENTLTKTWRMLSEQVPLPPLRLSLKKRIPVQSGLGGGSSNAAGVIRLAQRLQPRAVSADFARDVALAVGADVPFFLVGGRATGEGYGEILTPLPDPEPSWVCLAMPAELCRTAEAYAALDAMERPWRGMPEPAKMEFYNDFERVAPCGSLDLIERMQVFGASGAGLSGSGSAVFGVFDSQDRALQAQQRAIAEGAKWSEIAPMLSRAASLPSPEA